MYRYEYDTLDERLQELKMEENNWEKYYLESAEDLPRCQIEAIKDRITQIRNEREQLLHGIWGAE